MTRRLSYDLRSFFYALVILSAFYPAIVNAMNADKSVLQVCRCHFPSEMISFEKSKVTSLRYVVFSHIKAMPMMVREIFSEDQRGKYRIISLMSSTEKKTLGKVGPVLEILKWNGPYWPGEVLYQLSLRGLRDAYTKMINE